MAKSTKRRPTQVGPKKTRRVVGKSPNPQQVRKPKIGVAETWEVKEKDGKIVARLKGQKPMTQEQINTAMASEVPPIKSPGESLYDLVVAAEKEMRELQKNKRPNKFQVPIVYERSPPPGTPNMGASELYVTWAMEHLQDLNKFRKKLQGYSRLPVDNSLRVVIREMQRLVLNEPAYLEAAARLFVRQSVEYKGDHKLFVEGELLAPEWEGLIK